MDTFDLFRIVGRKRLYPVGRVAIDAEGYLSVVSATGGYPGLQDLCDDLNARDTLLLRQTARRGKETGMVCVARGSVQFTDALQDSLQRWHGLELDRPEVLPPGAVCLRTQLGTPPVHATGRVRMKDCSPPERNTFTRGLMERLSWFESAEGRGNMTGKGNNREGVVTGVLTSVLEHAAEAGMSPVQLLETALLSFEACNGGLDLRAMRQTAEELLDGYDAAAQDAAAEQTPGDA